MNKLTKLQKKFITEYIKTLDGELSAKKAGYKSDDLKTVAEHLLSNALIIKEIKIQLREQISSLRVHKAYVVHKLLEIAEFSLSEEDILDKEGNITGKKKLRDTTAGLRALESLCKYLGFKEEEKILDDTKIITIKNLDEDLI